MDTEQEEKTKNPRILPITITILIGAWIIGMSILGAGLLISKEIAKNNLNSNSIGQTASGPIDIEVPAGEPVLGNNNALVTIVEFADFQCPFCGQFQKEVFPQIKSNYIDTGKVRFVYMDYAFLGDESFKAAEAARCAMDQNKFWEYHDKLFASQAGENQGAFADTKLKQFAVDLGLNASEFNSCFDKRNYQTAIQNSLQKGSGYGVQSTPTIFINGLRVEGVMPFASYQQLIENELIK